MLSWVAQSLLIVIDVSLKSLLLAVVAFWLLRSLRVRNSSFRHRVWAGVLCGMLALPVLSRIVPALPLPFSVSGSWLETISGASVVTSETDRTEEPTADERAGQRPVIVSPASGSSNLSIASFPAEDPDGFDSSNGRSRGPFSLKYEPPEIGGSREPAEAVTDSLLPARDSRRAVWYDGVLRNLPIAVVFVWLTGVAVLTLRLLVGIAVTRGIVRRSRRPLFAIGSGSESVVPGSEFVDREFHVRFPDGTPDRLIDLVRSGCVAESSEIRVPVTVGLVRPVILVPAAWSAWTRQKLAAVLIHEASHVERRDFLIAILADVNRALYWFHPLSWWLRSRLSDLAEEACDDEAIGVSGDPAGYARHLLEVAETLSRGEGRVCRPGLSMARTSNVEGRIRTILDLRRPLSERLTKRTAAAIATVMLPVIALAAALQPAGIDAGRAVDSIPTAVAIAEPSEESTPDSVAEADAVSVAGLPNTGEQPVFGTGEKKDDANPGGEFVVTGRVIADGGAAEDVLLTVRRVRQRDAYAAEHTSKVVTTLTVKSGADFRLTIPAESVPDQLSDYRERPSEWLTVQATSNGYGLTAATIRERDEATAIQLRMKREVKITGRILNPEGRPVAGARLRISRVANNQSATLDTWIKERLKPGQPTTGSMYAMRASSIFDDGSPGKSRLQSRDLEIPIETFAPTATNTHGEFVLRGVGEDQMLQVVLSGPQIARTKLHILARDLTSALADASKARNVANALRLPMSGELVHGSNVNHVAAPSAPVTGVVRDRETRAPIAGITVSVVGLAGSPMAQSGWLKTVTDKDGRYTLNGMPTAIESQRFPGRINLASTDLPYISTDFSLPPTPGLDAIEFDMELQPCVMATGRLTDLATGQPVQGAVFYSPFSGNPFNTDYKRYSDGVRQFLGNDRTFVTDSEGRFQIPVISGRGVVGAICEDGRYRRAAGMEDIEEFQSARRSTVGLPGSGDLTNDFLTPLGMHVVKAIDVPNQTGIFEVDLQADRGKTVRLDLVAIDANGQSLNSKIRIQGAHARYRGSIVTKTPHVEVTGIDEGETRLVFVHDEPRTVGAVLEVTGKHKDLKIIVPPLITVRGQLVGVKKKPLQRRKVTAVVPNSGFYQVVQPTETNDRGYFELQVPAGGPYDIMTELKPGTASARPVRLKTGLKVTLPSVDVGTLGLPGGNRSEASSSRQDGGKDAEEPKDAGGVRQAGNRSGSNGSVSVPEPDRHIHGQVVENFGGGHRECTRVTVSDTRT